jgi:glycosyltransferase involved in cell wall biosynthesis
MTIVYMSNAIIPSQSANSIHVMKMCNAFSKYFKTTLFAIEGELNTDPYKYYGSVKNFSLITIKKSNNYIGSIKYIITVLFMFKNDKDTFVYGRNTLVLFLLSLVRANVAYEVHAIPSNKFRKLIERIIFNQKKFKKLIVISKALKKDYLQIFPDLKSSDIVVAHDGADLPKKKMVQRIVIKTFKVGYVGHLYQGRGIEIIIQLAKNFPEIEFSVVGGLDKDVKFWLKETAEINNIKFHGHVSHSALGEFYRIFDIMLAPYQIGINQCDGKSDTSRWMSPMKIFEYMSYSKPIISSDIPVLREVLNESNSILVAPSDIKAWTMAIKTLKCQVKRKNLGTRARSDLLKYYTWDKRAQLILRELKWLY